jgi:hypothetical protein
MTIERPEGDRPAPLAAGAHAEDGRAATFLFRAAKPLAAAEKSRRPAVAGRRSGRSPYPSARSRHRRTRRVGLVEIEGRQGGLAHNKSVARRRHLRSCTNAYCRSVYASPDLIGGDPQRFTGGAFLCHPLPRELPLGCLARTGSARRNGGLSPVVPHSKWKGSDLASRPNPNECQTAIAELTAPAIRRPAHLELRIELP